MQGGRSNKSNMKYKITTYRDGVLLGSVIADAQNLRDAEREAVKTSEIRGETVTDVFYPVGESRVETVQTVGSETHKFTRTIKPVLA